MDAKTVDLLPMPPEPGARPLPLIPTTWEEVEAWADRIIAGNMVPASYGVEAKDTGGDAKKAAEQTRARLVIGIEKGLEVGMGPVTALSTIMIVNNRPSVWGDGALALVHRQNVVEKVEQIYEGKEIVGDKNTISTSDFTDDFSAVFRIWRKGHEAAYEGRFSVRDAKRAHLWNNPRKQPWIEYPKRMLMARARAFALREGFSDCLFGLSIAEEMQDVPEAPPAKTDTSFLDDAPRPALEHKPAVPFTAPTQAEKEVVPDAKFTPTTDTGATEASASGQAAQRRQVVEEPPGNRADPAPPPEPASPKSASALAAYINELIAWIPHATDEALEAHQKRNEKWLGFIRLNRDKDQERIDLALDARRLR